MDRLVSEGFLFPQNPSGQVQSGSTHVAKVRKEDGVSDNGGGAGERVLPVNGCGRSRVCHEHRGVPKQCAGLGIQTEGMEMRARF